MGKIPILWKNPAMVSLWVAVTLECPSAIATEKGLLQVLGSSLTSLGRSGQSLVNATTAERIDVPQPFAETVEKIKTEGQGIVQSGVDTARSGADQAQAAAQNTSTAINNLLGRESDTDTAPRPWETNVLALPLIAQHEATPSRQDSVSDDQHGHSPPWRRRSLSERGLERGRGHSKKNTPNTSQEPWGRPTDGDDGRPWGNKDRPSFAGHNRHQDHPGRGKGHW